MVVLMSHMVDSCTPFFLDIERVQIKQLFAGERDLQI